MSTTPGRRITAFAVGGLLIAGTAVAIAVPTSHRTGAKEVAPLAVRSGKAVTAPGGAASAGGDFASSLGAGAGRSGATAASPASGGAAASPAAGATAASPPSGAAAASSAAGSAGSAGVAPALGAPQIATVGPLADTPVVADTVVRSGSVDVEVTKGHFADAFSAAADVARQVGGFVVATQMSTQVQPVPLGAATPDIAPGPVGRGVPAPGPTIGSPPVFPEPIGRSDVPWGTLTLRIPGSRFDDARRSLEHLGTVRAEQLSGQDSGGQIADLGARLADLHASQDGLRALVAKATSTAEVLQVQTQLNAVQQQIDGINAQLDRLHNAVALATIEVRVTEPFPVVAAAHPRSVLQLRLAQAGRGVEAVIGGTIVAAAYAVPLAVLGLLGWAVLSAGRRRRTARVPVV